MKRKKQSIDDIAGAGIGIARSAAAYYKKEALRGA